MSFLDCINSSSLTKGEKESIQKKFDELVKTYTQTMGDVDAASLAAKKIVEIEASRIKQKKINAQRSAIFQEKILKDIDQRFKEMKETHENLSRVGRAFSKTPSYSEAVRNQLELVANRQKSVQRQAAEFIGEFIEKNRAKWAGLVGEDQNAMRNVMREVLGESTGIPEAALFGAQIRKTFDFLHKRFTAGGGVIGKIDNYFPQFHSKELLRKNSKNFEEWEAFMLPLLDRSKMIDQRTGLPFTQKDLRAQMKGDYDDITTNGLASLRSRLDEGYKTSGKVSKEVSNRRDASRFYQFKDAQSFMAYNDRFGSGPDGYFQTILGHISTMSRDIGMLEKLGPKPNALMNRLKVEMQAKGENKVSQSWTEGMYDVLVGRTMSRGDEAAWYKALTGAQDIMRSAYLGSAPISALSDTVFAYSASAMNGLSGTKVFKQYLKTLNPANKADRETAKMMGYVIDIANGASLSAARFAEEASGNKTTRWLATFTNKASGLEAMTEGIKTAITFEFHGQLARFKNTGYADLPKEFRKAGEIHGLNEDVWNVVRKAELITHPEREVSFLRPTEIAKIRSVTPTEALNASNIIDDWTSSLRTTASNEPALRTRAITTGALVGDATPGTVNRAMFGSLMMFKGFPISVMFNHLIPSIRNAAQGRMGQLMGVTVGMTVMGGLALQLAEIAKGRDAKPMNDRKFWTAAMMKGGGFGIYGDFLFGDYSRFGRSPVEQALGPTVGLGADVGRVFMGNFQKAMDDDNYRSNFMRDSFNLLKRNVPAGNLWYARLALERGFFDAVERQLDPKFYQNAARKERLMRNRTGQSSWWRKGQTAPDRAPRLQ